MKILTRRLLNAILVVCAASFTLPGGGCSDEREDRTLEQIALSRSTVAFAVKGGTTAISVAAPEKWNAKTAAAWITLSQDETALTITAKPNDETASVREAEVEIASGDNIATLTVRQEPAAAVSLEVKYGPDPKIDSEGGTFTVRVETKSTWTASLLNPVEGWNLKVDSRSGICQIEAGANNGETKSGTLVVTAGSESLNHSELIGVQQISRAENTYYQFTGDWGMYAPNWWQGGTNLGKEGVYAMCSIGEVDYASDKLGVYGLFIKGGALEMLEIDRTTRKCTLPLGYLTGVTMANGYEFYLYLVALDLKAGKYSTEELCGELSEDATTILFPEMPESFNQLGLIGYNVYVGYTFFSNLYYASGPGIELRRSSASQTTSADEPQLRAPSGTLPDGILKRLPENTQGECRMLTAKQSDNL